MAACTIGVLVCVTHSHFPFSKRLTSFFIECQGREFAPTGNYSPMFNDIWSLSSSTISRPVATPGNLLPSVIPPSKHAYATHSISSHEINVILVRMLKVDWRKGMMHAIQRVNNGLL